MNIRPEMMSYRARIRIDKTGIIKSAHTILEEFWEHISESPHAHGMSTIL